jgi:hypothetical protein
LAKAAFNIQYCIPERLIWTLKYGKVVAAHFAIHTPAVLAPLA